MKKLLILTAVGALLTAPATAVQKCVALNDSATCNAAPYNFVNKSDWMATCTTNGVSVLVKGIGICGASINNVTGYPTYDSISTDGAELCWCRMISPAISKWVKLQTYDASSGGCAMNCAMGCASKIMAARSPGSPYYFNSSLFSDLTN